MRNLESLSSSQSSVPQREAVYVRVLKSALRFVRSSPIAAISAILLTTIVMTAALADQIAPYPPLETNYDRLVEPPSRDHWLGTDHVGRDVLSRIIHGARASLFVAMGAVLFGDLIGIVWGVTSGYIGRRFDLVSQRLLDVLLAFPGLVLALLFVVALGRTVYTVIFAIGITMIPASTRITRAVAMSVKEAPYVEAARVVGASSSRIMFRHVMPQCVAAFLVVVTAHLGIAITTEAALSFLGIGVAPPTPTWGNMLGGATALFFNPPWWLAVAPGLVITITVLSANMFGDAIRDALDPSLRGRS